MQSDHAPFSCSLLIRYFFLKRELSSQLEDVQPDLILGLLAMSEGMFSQPDWSNLITAHNAQFVNI